MAVTVAQSTPTVDGGEPVDMPNDFDDVFKPRKVERTARYTLSSVPKIYSDKHAVLIGKHAGDLNKPYINAMFKIANAARATSGGALTPERFEADKVQSRKMLATYCLVGWENVNSRDGKPIPFSQPAVLELLDTLAQPDRYPDAVSSAIGFFADRENFLTSDELPIDGEALGEG